MTDVLDDPVSAAWDRFLSALDVVTSLDVGGFSPSQLSLSLQRQETARRRMAGFDHRLVAELSEQVITGRVPTRNAVEVLVQSLRLAPSEARSRVRAAADLGPRRSLTGEALPPVLPLVAGGQDAGVVSAAQAAVIRQAISTLRPALRAEHGTVAEALLVTHAAQFNPKDLAVVAQRILEQLDPDGQRPSDEVQQQRRRFGLKLNPDGSSNPYGQFTPELTAQLHAVLSVLTQPRAGEAGGPTDEAAAAPRPMSARSMEQRQHDALAEIVGNVQRSGGLPSEGGLPAAVYITVPLDVLEERINGVATTLFGRSLTVAEMLRVASDAQLIPIVIDKAGVPLDVGYAYRTCTTHIRHCLNMRDEGCVYPGCTIPAQWCEAHHLIPWISLSPDQPRGKTKLDNLALLCTFHHHVFEKWGWVLYMDDGLPWWIPPVHVDPDQKPIRNTARHLQLNLDQLTPAARGPD